MTIKSISIIPNISLFSYYSPNSVIFSCKFTCIVSFLHSYNLTHSFYPHFHHIFGHIVHINYLYQHTNLEHIIVLSDFLFVLWLFLFAVSNTFLTTSMCILGYTSWNQYKIINQWYTNKNNSLCHFQEKYQLELQSYYSPIYLFIYWETPIKSSVFCLGELLITKKHYVIGDKYIYLFNHQAYEKMTEKIFKPKNSKLHF